MEEKEIKHMIALLLEDAKRLQEIEPNSGTAARIQLARDSLASSTQGQTKCETEDVITVYGHKVNRSFAYHVLDGFAPTLHQIIRDLTLRGMDRKAVEDAATTAASAAVVGMRSLILPSKYSSPQELCIS